MKSGVHEQEEVMRRHGSVTSRILRCGAGEEEGVEVMHVVDGVVGFLAPYTRREVAAGTETRSTSNASTVINWDIMPLNAGMRDEARR